MKIFRAFIFFVLLGGDYRLEPASLEAFPQAYGCDGRANLLFAPAYPVLLRQPRFIGGTVLLVPVLLLLFQLIKTSTDLHKPVSVILHGVMLRYQPGW